MKIEIEKQRMWAMAALLAWCVVLIFVDMTRTANGFGHKTPIGLLWNLFLAVVPLFWSLAFQAATARKRPILSGVCFALWLLFLPNAPYILTDLLHLRPRDNTPLWFLLALLLSCAGTGTLLGYFSLLNVHETLERKYGKRVGWSVAFGSLMLCGFGIYVGRFLRWNSWDALTHPWHLLENIAAQFAPSSAHPHPLSVTLVFGIGLILGYCAVRVTAFAAKIE